MRANHKIAIALFAGIAVGALAMQGLHAQAKPPAYVIAEIDVTNPEGYAKEYQPLALKAITSAKFLARNTKTASLRGEPPKRIIQFAFENMDQAQAAFNSLAYTEAWTIGSKHANFRICAVEGMPQ